MSHLSFPSRRGLIAGGTGVAFGIATPGFARVPRRTDVDGKTSWSESVMVVYLSDDLQTGISYRICRFPDLGDCWVWCTAIVEGRMYAFTDGYLPCSTVHNVPDSAAAIYDVPNLAARMTRIGTSAEMQRMSFSFNGNCHAGTAPREGGGRIAMALEGMFYPARAHGAFLPGRFERLGRIEATLTLAGREIAIAGIAKQHEQTQTAPRFLESFTYCNLWNARSAFLGLLVGSKGGGDLETDGTSKKLTSFSIAPPGKERRFEGMLADGTKLEGAAHATISFGIPVYSRVWHGTMVSADVGGEKMVGMLNDWRPENQSYAP